MAHGQRLESNGLISPALTLTVISKEETGTPESPFILALPAEILFQIFEEPKLWKRDRANLRLVCKDLSTYATQVLAKQCFSSHLDLDVGSEDFVRLAAICSSQFRPFIKSVHFAHDWKRRVTQKIKATNPDYSAIRDIKFEAHLEMLDSTYTFKKVLQQVNNLETFIFSLIKADKDNCRCDLCRLPRLSDRSWWDMDGERFLVEMILSDIKSDCLSELVFANTILSYKTLKGLLERHRGTIRKLSIRGCELTGGTWIDLLQWISHNLPSLENLVLQNLQELKWRRVFNKYDHSDMMWETLFTTTGKKNLDTYIATLRDEDASG